MWREIVVCSALAVAISGSESRGTRVAVVDLHRVLTTAKRFEAGDASIRAWMTEQKAALGKKQDALKAKKAELELFSKGSPERARVELEIAKATLDLDYEVAAADSAREDRVVEHQRECFDAATRAIQEVAKLEGIELVLQLRTGPLTSVNQRELSSEIFLREVLAADGSLDITSRVLSMIDR
jgi:Skp family chaperone for outer membrane proteins